MMKRNSCDGQLKRVAAQMERKVWTVVALGAVKGAEATVKSRPSSVYFSSADTKSLLRKINDAKRQRTTSRSISPPPEIQRLPSQAESDDGIMTRVVGSKKIRGAAARNHREKELREEKERQRLEAKQKRMGRAERRRVDGKLDQAGHGEHH